MAQVTLIGDRLAREGQRFVFRGGQPECEGCRLKGPCLNLEPGRLYAVRRVRDVHHPDACVYHENGVRAVEVEPVPVAASLRAGVALEGSVLQFRRPVCANRACRHFDLCHPSGLPEGIRVRVKRRGDRLVCPIGYELVATVVEPG